MTKKRGIEKIKIKHNKKLFWIIIILLAILIVLILFIINERNIEKDIECKEDSDCVKQQITCCSCNMGGKEICAPRKNVSEYAPKNCPTGVKLICTAVYNCKIEKCVCKEGKCIAEMSK